MKRSGIKKTVATVILLAVTALLIFGIAPFTLAWLKVETEPKTNTFTPGAVTLEIEETLTGTTKSNVKFQNTGNVPAFIRVALVPIWRSGTYNSGLAAIAGEIYTISLNTGDGLDQWTKSGDYYYYNSPVPAKGFTTNLINSASPAVDLDEHPEYTGMTFELQVIASALQADGWNGDTDSAVEAFAEATDETNSEF